MFLIFSGSITKDRFTKARSINNTKWKINNFEQSKLSAELFASKSMCGKSKWIRKLNHHLRRISFIFSVTQAVDVLDSSHSSSKISNKNMIRTRK